MMRSSARAYARRITTKRVLRLCANFQTTFEETPCTAQSYFPTPKNVAALILTRLSRRLIPVLRVSLTLSAMPAASCTTRPRPSLPDDCDKQSFRIIENGEARPSTTEPLRLAHFPPWDFTVGAVKSATIQHPPTILTQQKP